MFHRFDEAIHAVVEQIVIQTNDLCHRIGHTVCDEDDFTSRMADRIERSIDRLLFDGVTWQVATRKLSWRGHRSEESQYGADLALIVRMSGYNFDVSKGYLIQAKLRHSPYAFGHSPIAKSDRIFDQCHKMLKISQESYVWFYSETGIHIIRAGSMIGTDSVRIPEMHPQTLHGFMTRAFMSWSGDYKLGDLSKNGLEKMIQKTRVKQAILVHATDAREEE